MYKHTDEAIKRINQRVVERFKILRLRIASYDEINVISAIQTVYREMYEDIVYYLLMAAQDEYDDAIEGKIYHRGIITQSWLNDKLNKRDTATQYIFSSEFFRMAERFSEYIADLITDDEMPSRTDYEQEMKRLSLVIGEEAIFITDEAVKQAYKDAGVQKVMWVTARDERVCKFCRPLNGTVYALQEAPNKQHRHCRCVLVPVSI